MSLRKNYGKHTADLKAKIRRFHPRSIVGVATIPIISFAKAQEHYKAIKQLHTAKYDETQLQSMQKRLSDLLATINTDLSHLNSEPQEIPGVGHFYASQLFLHQDIEKQVIRKSKSKRTVIKRIPDKKLTDGVHPSEAVNEVWYMALHENYMKIISAVTSHLNASNE